MSTKICKICGKEYEACKPAYTTNVYRWQDVACCQEHGAEYFRQVELARSGAAEVATEPEKPAVLAVDPTEELQPDLETEGIVTDAEAEVVAEEVEAVSKKRKKRV